MPLLSVVLQDVVMVALVVTVVSFLAHRFVWRNLWVYAAVVGGCVEIAFVILTGLYVFGFVAWMVGYIASAATLSKRPDLRL